MRATRFLRQPVASNSAYAPINVQKAVAYATSLLRKSDADAFWPSFWVPASARPAYLAIRALNVELASVDEQVSNPVVGRLRYQWWREAVKSAFDSKPLPHPLIQLLSILPQRNQLSSYHFTRLINAREAHFLNPSFTTLQDLAEYSAGTQASLLYLLLQSVADSPTGKQLPHAHPFQHLGGEHENKLLNGFQQKELKPVDSLTLDHAASHLAVATTITILLRSIPHHASKRINVIPAEIASRHSLKEENLFRIGPLALGLQESVATLVGIAEAELRTSRACFDGTTGIPEQSMPVFLAATPARSFLDRLSCDKIDFNIFSPELHKRYWKVPFQVWGDARNKRF